MTHNHRRRGRPATGQTPVRSVRIGPIWDEAKAIAKANNETISSVIERKLTEYVKNARTRTRHPAEERVVTEIPEPPRQRECPTCGPITWLWSPRHKWVPFVAAGDSETIRRHTCAAVTDAELRKADELAWLMRMLTGNRTVQTATVEEKYQIRKLLANRVDELARLTGEDHAAINYRLNQICGDGVAAVDPDGLKRRLVLVEQWIAEAER